MSVREKWLRWWLRGLWLVPSLGVLLVSDYSFERRVGMTIFSLLAFGGFAWPRARLQATLDRNTRYQAVARAYFVLGIPLDLFMVVQLVSARGAPDGHWLAGPVTQWVGPVWYSAHAILFFAYLLGALWRSGAAWVRRRLDSPAPVVDPSRRQFLEGGAVVAAGMPFVISLSGVGTSYDFQVEEREVHLPGWPRSLDGLRVAHLSDIHVGGAMNAARLNRVAELTNGARPDMVLHTGDFLTHREGDFDAPLYPALARIQAPLGHFACRGNHDFDDFTGFPRKLRDAGVTPLINREARVDAGGEEVRIGGLDYVFPTENRGPAYAANVEGLGPHDGEPRILLLHDPAQWVHMPEDSGNLVLSGHTHGGHIGVQLGQDALWTVVGAFGWPDQGVFRREDSMRLFVTRCVGFYGYPLRIGIPPEIALLTLRSA